MAFNVKDYSFSCMLTGFCKAHEVNLIQHLILFVCNFNIVINYN